MARNKVNPKKGNQTRNWQGATHMRSASSMIAGLENVAKHGSKKEKSIPEQAKALLKSLERANKQKARLELKLREYKQAKRVPSDLRELFLAGDKEGENRIREKLNGLEKVISMKLFNLNRLQRLELANRTREKTRQKTIKAMEKGIFPNDNALIPTAIARKIKKAGKPATLETVFTRNVTPSQMREIGKPFKKPFSLK